MPRWLIAAVLLTSSVLLLVTGVPRWAGIPAVAVILATLFWLIQRSDERADDRRRNRSLSE
jgi:hypothetical protein